MTSWNNATRATQRGQIRYAQEEERLKQQAAEQQNAVQAEAARQQQQKSSQEQGPSFNPLAVIQQAFQPVAEGLENFTSGISSSLYETFGLGTREEWFQKRDEGRRSLAETQQHFEREAYKGPLNTIGSEALRTIVASPVRLLEGVLDTGALVTDTVLTPFRNDPKRNPFDARYERAKFDFGVQGPKTQIGQTAERLVTFTLAMRQAAARLPQAAIGLGTGGKGLKGAIASGIVPGMVADFLLTNPEDGNISSLVKELVPEEYRETFLLALAVEEGDNPWAAKLKSMIEGGFIVGPAIDTVMFGGRAAARAVLRKGGTKEEALRKGLEHIRNAPESIEPQYRKNAAAENRRWTDAQELEMEKLLDRERRLNVEMENMRQQGIPDDDPRMSNLRLEMEETARTMSQLDNEIIRGFDLEGRELTNFERAAFIEPSAPTRVAAQQFRLENAPLPRPVQSGNLPPSTRVNSPSLGGTDHILTDAAYRILNLSEGVEQLVRDTTKRTDLQAMARSLGMSDEEVLGRAARVVQDFRDATQAWNAPVDDVREVLRQAGALDKASNAMSGEVLTREGVVALKALISDTSNQIFDLATNAAQMAKAQQAGGNQFDRLVDRLVAMLELHKQAANFHGGGLRAFGLDLQAGVKGSGSPDQIDLTMREARNWANKIKDLARTGDPSAKEEMDRLVEAMVLAGGDPTKTVSFAHQAAAMGGKKLMDGMYNSILSGPATHLRNTFGNAYALLERPASITLSGLLKGDTELIRSAGAGYHAIISSVGEAWQVAARSFKVGESINQNSKFVLQDATYRAQLKQMKMVAEASGDASKLRAVGFLELQANMMDNPFFSWPNRTLTAADDFFKTLNARQHIQTESMYKALTQAQSANDVDGLFQQYMENMSKGIDPTTGRILDSNLLEYAERATFQNDPGTIINSLTNFLNAFPAGRVFVPFVRTPANLLSYVGQHTPVLARHLTHYKEVMRSGDPVKIAEMQGREALGGMFVALAGIGATTGNITGSGPVDPRERRIWEMTHEPKSIKIGDKWVSYRGIEPLETILSIAADTAGLAAMGALDSAEKLAGQLTYAISAGLIEKSYVAGLAELSNVINPSNWTADGAARGILATANSFIPMSAARRALSNTLDPYLKEVNSELERALNSAVPGHKLLGTTKIDWLTGEEQAASGGGLWNAASPFRIVDKGQDPVKDMLVDINFETKDLLKFGNAGVELDAERRAALAKEMHATGVYDKLDRLRKQPWFKQSVKDWRNKGFRWSAENDRPRHYSAVQRIVDQSRSAALRKLEITDPGLAQMVRDARKTSVQYRRGIYNEVESLTNFPN